MNFIKNEIKLFVISGKARSGKGEITKIINNYYKEKKCINISFAYYLKQYAKKISNWDGREETKPRELLQQLGTEVIRRNIDSLFFVDEIIKDIKVYSFFFKIIP